MNTKVTVETNGNDTLVGFSKEFPQLSIGRAVGANNEGNFVQKDNLTVGDLYDL